jgi:hypothetical protein
MRFVLYLCLLGCYGLAYGFVFSMPADASPLKDSALLFVKAKCRSQATLYTPHHVKVIFQYQSTRFQSDMSAMMYTELNDSVIETPAALVKQNWPSSNTLSAVFLGPLVRATYYCENSHSGKDLAMSYQPVSGLKIYFSKVMSLMRLELQHTPKDEVLMHLQAEGKHMNIFQAGNETASPYWLQLSIRTDASSREKIQTLFTVKFL